MGTLIGKAYPTSLLGNQADHTYVECGTGKVGWGCWGGKTGGREITRGTGSTKQANAIASPNERGGIKCYALNGVCHQAANRILWPSRRLVINAKGYWVSSSMFGTYGRENRNFLHVCEAPFNQQNGVTGDMPQCSGQFAGLAQSPSILSDKQLAISEADLVAQTSFAEAAMAVHGKLAGLAVDDVKSRLSGEAEHFSLQSQFRLGAKYTKKLDSTLCSLRTGIEKQRIDIEQAYMGKASQIDQFADAFNKLTIQFQDQMA